MKTLYLDCGMGAAGDMLLAALYELCPDRNGALARLNGMGIPHVAFTAESVKKCGVSGTHMKVTVDGGEEHEHHGHSHMHLSDIGTLIDSLNVPMSVKSHAKEVYESIAAAESAVHGEPMQHIHFHEVGSLDAVADVTGVCLMLEMLKPERIIASPVHVGYGTVRCAHGILPVPAPATALLLKGIPTYTADIEGELCTPTGAALLRHFASEYCPMPAMATSAIGYGMGRKDFPRINCVRAMMGDTVEDFIDERIICLECNVDDMTGEEIGFALEQMLSAGAKDAWSEAIYMKKNRPGQTLKCIVNEGDVDRLVAVIFKNTSTIGIRRVNMERYLMARETETVTTELGTARRKLSYGYGATRKKYEYEDLARIAREKGMSLSDVRKVFEKQ